MTTSRANQEEGEKLPLVVVQRRLGHKWEVTPVGRSRSQSFPDLELAVGDGPTRCRELTSELALRSGADHHEAQRGSQEERN